MAAAKGKRVHAASVMRRHGAYLISWDCGEISDVVTPVELYDCAASLAGAKRVAVEGARSFGYVGAIRWSNVGHRLELEMGWHDDDDEAEIQW